MGEPLHYCTTAMLEFFDGGRRITDQTRRFVRDHS
jgi:hypothetical protein